MLLLVVPCLDVCDNLLRVAGEAWLEVVVELLVLEAFVDLRFLLLPIFRWCRLSLPHFFFGVNNVCCRKRWFRKSSETYLIVFPGSRWLVALNWGMVVLLLRL